MRVLENLREKEWRQEVEGRVGSCEMEGCVGDALCVLEWVAALNAYGLCVTRYTGA